jgi:hypothetical protein
VGIHFWYGDVMCGSFNVKYGRGILKICEGGGAKKYMVDKKILPPFQNKSYIWTQTVLRNKSYVW